MSFDDTQVRYFLDCIKGNVFTLSLYYVVSILIILSEVIWMSFVVCFFRVCQQSIKMKLITDYLVEYYFSTCKSVPKLFSRVKKK